MEPKRPVLRWHGGKWKLAPWIIGNFPAHRVYVEPYGGGGSVLMRKDRSYAEVYNDLDGDVVTLFRVLRDDPLPLISALELTPFARDEHAISTEPTEDPIERARRLCIRSFMGFGSNGHNIKRKTGFRANSNRSGTTPARDWLNYPESLGAIIKRLRGIVIENRDACKCMAHHDSTATLHYVDPPYVPETRSGLMHTPQVYSHEMTNEDHRAMAECLHGLRGMVVLSGYRSSLYDELFDGWRTLDRAAHADGAKDRTETLWFNAAAWSALHHHDSLMRTA